MNRLVLYCRKRAGEEEKRNMLANNTVAAAEASDLSMFVCLRLPFLLSRRQIRNAVWPSHSVTDMALLLFPRYSIA